MTTFGRGTNTRVPVLAVRKNKRPNSIRLRSRVTASPRRRPEYRNSRTSARSRTALLLSVYCGMAARIAATCSFVKGSTGGSSFLGILSRAGGFDSIQLRSWQNRKKVRSDSSFFLAAVPLLVHDSRNFAVVSMSKFERKTKPLSLAKVCRRVSRSLYLYSEGSRSPLALASARKSSHAFSISGDFLSTTLPSASISRASCCARCQSRVPMGRVTLRPSMFQSYQMRQRHRLYSRDWCAQLGE